MSDSVNTLREFALQLGLKTSRGKLDNAGNVSEFVRLIIQAIRLGRITEETFKGMLDDR